MNKEKLNIIIGTMALALLGLIGLQFYWINTSLSVNRDKFSNRVHNAMTEVVKKLEKQEAYQIARMNMENSVNILKDDFMMDYDSMGNPNWTEEKRIQSRQVFSPNTPSQGYKYEVKEEVVISKSGFARKLYDNIGEKSSKGMSFSPVSLNPVIDSINWLDQIKQNSGFRMSRKSELVSLVLNEWMLLDKDIKNRVNSAQIDSLLKQEINNQGIDIDFYYAVESRENRNPEIVFSNTSDSEFLNKALKSNYKTKLFPTDVFDKLNMLHLYFPDTNSFIIKEMWFLLAASILFISLVIYGFGYAIFTIIRQKKLSEITNDFISNMTHELKTPISTVSLATEALMDPDIRSLPNQSTRYLNIIKEENERLSMQVEKVLQIARLDRGDFKLNVEKVDMHEAINQAIANIALQVETRDGEISAELTAENFTVEGDQVHLINIINNLLDNANKYSPESPKITIKTEQDKLNNRFKLQIGDKGLGMAKDTQDKIFDKFYRVPTGNLHDVKGFGLGLSYVKTMIDAHHGTINVQSEPRKGSTFTISLPYKYG